ncbi:hypothetical protein [Agromyces seonyuensis]|uniref:Uncharacterized protein n=1 Tax=Agromyces seonyuensis TaxID=2662446 RepID=A0A6I4P833_9MICO|nr:hypothetical protein [Agromyces seonyuensis]MWC00028.1 hypothetical protein [Agromyces seonyuensis]
MELLFITVGGAIFGLGAHWFLPRRTLHGAVLLPMIGAATAAVVWVALTWLGMAWDGGWIWVISIAVSIAVPVAVDLFLGPRREQADQIRFERLARPGSGVA